MEEKEVVENKVPERMTQEQIEDLLMERGVLIPANDLVHYMTRNASYMKLITSEQFKESGIDLEVILDDKFIREQFENNGKTAEAMRYVTEKVIAKMNELPTEAEEVEEVKND